VILRELDRAVVVAMIAVRMMQPPVHQIVDVIAVGNRFMTAAGTVGMACAAYVRRALHRIASADGERVLVDVIAMHVVQVPVMQVIDVTVVTNCRVSAVRTMPMTVIGVMGQVTCGHDFLQVDPSQRRSIA
jgi:hypothetical protein